MASSKTTSLDSDVTKPAVTQPGDGAHDTTDPLERASTVVPQPGDEALAAGTVNSQKPLDPIPGPTPRNTREDRFEEYDLVRPNGEIVHLRRNIETGESRVVEPKADTGTTAQQAPASR